MLSRYLDEKAIIRTRSAFIIKTNDVINVKWLGRQCYQFPLDAWLIQEVISEQKPDLIIETGTFMGGSAYYFACLCSLLNHGEVISIDIKPQSTISHPRITYIEASSTDEAVLEKVKARIAEIGAEKVLVILDSDHSAAHVKKELELYSSLVPIGCYIHVQDGTIDELSMMEGLRPGPMAAAEGFLNAHHGFMRDIDLEKRYLLTEHPYGWLKRICYSHAELDALPTQEGRQSAHQEHHG